MESKQAELQNAVNAMMDKVELDKLRPLQKKLYLKMAECYSSRSNSSQEVQQCAGNWAHAGQAVQNIIQGEMNQFQDRLQRCSMSCQDEVRDRYPNPSGNAAAEKMATKCLSTCADKHIAMLKSIKYNIEKQVDEINSKL